MASNIGKWVGSWVGRWLGNTGRATGAGSCLKYRIFKNIKRDRHGNETFVNWVRHG